MILQPETDLTVEQYDDLIASTGENPVFQAVVYQVMPEFADSGGFSAMGAYDFGSCIYQGELWRVTGWGEVSVFNGTSWATDTISAIPNRNPNIGVSVVTDGSSLYVYGCGDDGIYEIVYDGSSWGSWTKIVDNNSIIAIASPAPLIVYFAEYDSTYHSLLKKYDDGDVTFSGVYWPYKIASIAAAIVSSGKDVVCAISPMPGILKYRYTANQVTKEITRSYGVVSFVVEDGIWSDHREIDFILESSTAFRFRSALKISVVNEEIFLTAYSLNGTEDHPFGGYRIFSTVDGDHWTRAEFASLPDGYEIYGVEIRPLGEQLFAVQGGKVYVADSTIYFNYAADSTFIDLTNEVVSMNIERTDMAQVSLALSGATGWFDPSILVDGGRFWLDIQLGVEIEGVSCMVPAGVFEVDSLKNEISLPNVTLQVTGRDFLSWLSDFSEVEDVKNWAPQILGGDKYQDGTQTGFGGMGHTEIVDGTYRTLSNTLRIVGNNEEGVSFNTFPTDVVSPTELWNFRTSIGIQLAKASNNEYAGIVFRGQDKDNLWCAVYQQNIDKIQIIERRAGVNYVRATSASTLGWSDILTVPKYLMVTQRYAQIDVFISSDNKSWSANISFVADGEAGTYYPQTGYCGTIGKGYSDEGNWDIDFEWPVFDIPVAEFDFSFIAPGTTPLSEQVRGNPNKTYSCRAWALDARDANCMIVTAINPSQSKLTTRNRSLGLTGKGRAGAQDPHHPENFYALMSTGLYRNTGLFGNANWTLVATMSEITGSGSLECYFFEMPKGSPDGYMAAWGHNNIFCFSTDSGASWEQRTLGPEATEPYEYIMDTPAAAGSYNQALSIAFSPYNSPQIGRVFAMASRMYDWVAGSDDYADYPRGSQMWSDDWGDTWTDKYSTEWETGWGVPKILPYGIAPHKIWAVWDYPTPLIENKGSNSSAVFNGWGVGFLGYFSQLTPGHENSNYRRYVGGTEVPTWVGDPGSPNSLTVASMVYPKRLNGCFIAVVVLEEGAPSSTDCGILTVSSYPDPQTEYAGDIYESPGNSGTPWMAGAHPLSHRLSMHRYDEDMLVWRTVYSDQAGSQFGRMRMSFDMGQSWTDYLQQDFSSFDFSSTDCAIAFFDFDYTQWFVGENLEEDAQIPFDWSVDTAERMRGWLEYSPAMSNGTKVLDVTEYDGLTGTITGPEDTSPPLIEGLVVYRPMSSLGNGTLPRKLRFGSTSPLLVWQAKSSSGSKASQVFPDGQHRYKITKPYVFVQWFEEDPLGIQWFEYT